jgi:SRSO17 transposase
MHHLVAKAAWEAQAVLRVARDYALTQLERHAPVGAWVVDDTGMPKKGRHSVGVARQYGGPLGKQDNCQVAVTVSLANAVMSVPAAYQRYLPEAWAKDRRRCRAAAVPTAVKFHKKWEIALAQIDRLLTDDLPRAPVVADAGCGVATEFREGLAARRLSYAVGISAEVSVCGPQASSRYCPSGADRGGRRPWCAAARPIAPSRSSIWRRSCRRRRRPSCAGVKARRAPCVHGSRTCACVSR